MTSSENLPIFPLGTVLYPGAVLPLHVFEQRYRTLMHDHGDDDPIFGVVLTKTGREVFDEPEMHAIGTSASLLGARRSVDGRYDIAVRGGRRFRLLGGDWSRSYFVAAVEWLDEPVGDVRQAGPLRREVIDAYESFLDAIARTVDVSAPEVNFPEDPVSLSYAVAARLPLDAWERQGLLETPDGATRLKNLREILRRERALFRDAGAAGPAIEHPGLRFSPN